MYANSYHARNGSGGSLMGDLLKGALAGAAAVWVMDRVDWFNFNHEDPAARRQTVEVRPGGMDPAHVAANKLAQAVGTELSPTQLDSAGAALHYSLGIGPASLYSAMRHRMDRLGMARGPLFGLGLFLVQDEALNAVSGLSARPRDYPWQAHARGLVAHLVFGVVTEVVLNVMDSLGRSQRHASRHY